jgi:hypothetical protein
MTKTYREETDGLLEDALRTLRTGAVWGWESLVEKLSKRGEAEPVVDTVPVVRPTASAAKPRSLRELGVPGTLASDFEVAFSLLGAVRDDRIVGFKFRTTDGVTHALRAEPSCAPALRRAA